MKNQSRYMFFLSIIASALIFLFGTFFKPHGIAWLLVLSAVIVAFSQAIIMYTREKIVFTQHELITRHIQANWRRVDHVEQSAVSHPHA